MIRRIFDLFVRLSDENVPNTLGVHPERARALVESAEHDLSEMQLQIKAIERYRASLPMADKKNFDIAIHAIRKEIRGARK